MQIKVTTSKQAGVRFQRYADERAIKLSRAVLELALYGLEAYEAGGAVIVGLTPIEELYPDALPRHGGRRAGAGRKPGRPGGE
jgi:hypothetical protein